MASRTTWEGYLKVSLLSIPVKAHTAATPGKGRIGFHLLHAKCNSRIKYKKVDAETGREVEADDIIKGTRSAKGSTSKLIGGTRRGRAAHTRPLAGLCDLCNRRRRLRRRHALHARL